MEVHGRFYGTAVFRRDSSRSLCLLSTLGDGDKETPGAGNLSRLCSTPERRPSSAVRKLPQTKPAACHDPPCVPLTRALIRNTLAGLRRKQTHATGIMMCAVPASQRKVGALKGSLASRNLGGGSR